MFERRDTGKLTCTIIALVRLVAAATIRERRLFRSALAHVRYYSRALFIRERRLFSHIRCTYCMLAMHLALHGVDTELWVVDIQCK